ncbi:MAG: hypothetical protein IKT13_02665 [Paludibacteraceae bacterium]|nr:hypothetical protein [Paludibacteraceae bacterium]
MLYCVAEHIFAIDASPEQLAKLPNYTPFQITNHQSPITNHLSPLFTVHVHEAKLPSIEGWEEVYTDRSDEDMPRIEMYRQGDEWLFCVSMYRESEVVSAMRCSADWREVHLFTHPACMRFAVDNAVMLVYAFATVKAKTLLFHSSVIVKDGVGMMFLGHSGTGKSTHSRQWLTAFEDASLLNDDNPVVRVKEDGEVRVYGSPWSGKTPCYKNEDVPVCALVQLAQAPENKIRPLRMTQAYPYILGSVSGLKVLPEMMDSLYEAIAELLEKKPVYHLECLPNPDAARLCAQTCLPSSCRTDN